MEQNIFSLQGIIFQEGHDFGLANNPGMGISLTINTAMRYAMFHGVVGPNEENPTVLSGNMEDPWGQSLIHEFTISEEMITFKKQYQRRPIIDYLFKQKENGIWIGTYSGPDCGIEKTKMIVTALTESFFDHP